MNNIIFKLGDLEVYSVSGIIDMFNRTPPAPNEYYWRNKAFSMGIGPFSNVYDTVKHYETFILTPAIPLPEDLKAKDTIISVDFVRKIRLKPMDFIKK